MQHYGEPTLVISVPFSVVDPKKEISWKIQLDMEFDPLAEEGWQVSQKVVSKEGENLIVTKNDTNDDTNNNNNNKELSANDTTGSCLLS